MSFAHVDVEGLVFLISSFSLILILFLPPPLWDSLSYKGRDLMETSKLWLNVPRFLILFVMSCYESLYLFPFARGGGFSDDG